MISIRNAQDRGTFNLGWLETWHSFSFGSYHDPQHMGYGSLRVINEDYIQPGQGFGTHGHKDMEIITYIISGALEHRDSLGNGSVIRQGDVQRMTAGTGVMHSEFNHLQDEVTHLLQIWIMPDRKGHEPGYEEKHFADADKRNRLKLIASADAREGSLTIHQDIDLFAASIDKGSQISHGFRDGRRGWLQLVRGQISVNGNRLGGGDGASIAEEDVLTADALEDAEMLLFDMG